MTETCNRSEDLNMHVRLQVLRRELRLRLREKLEFDSPMMLRGLGRLGALAGIGIFHVGRRRAGLGLLTKVHRANCSSWSTRFAEAWIRWAAGKESLRGVYRNHYGALVPTMQTRRFFEEPQRLLGPVVMVLKSPGSREKGIIVINYSFAFPLFARLFDVTRVASRYHLVLEPSWSGYCTPDILCYSLLDEPVFVQAYEPRDRELLDHLESNLMAVPVSANWWVDHRVFRPAPERAKNVDFVMIASWADFKRFGQFFSAVRVLRKRRPHLKVVLVGYPAGRTKEDICTLAMYHGVADLVEIHEWLAPEKVAGILSRSKVNIIWSRREGVNRAIIEGMFANVPCVLREGFNYGYRYPYINEMTGCFSSERELPEKLEWLVTNHSRFEPREWVMKHMSAQRAAELLGESVRGVALARGERWTREPTVKVNRLHDMAYWDESDRERFEADYAFLRTTLRSHDVT